jgi:hypothetical protein
MTWAGRIKHQAERISALPGGHQAILDGGDTADFGASHKSSLSFKA